MTGTGLYAYAIVPAGDRLDLGTTRGIADAPLEVIARHDLAVVVSPVELATLDVDEDDLSEEGALARLARRHDEVIRAVFDQSPVLPLRFGTVVRDRAGVEDLVDAQHGEVRDVLDRLRGHREWGVRLRRTAPSRPASDDAEARSREAARAESGAAYLARRSAALRAQEAARQREHDLVENVTAELEPYVTDSARRSGRQGGTLLADVAFLVDQAQENAFLAAAERLAAEAAAHEAELETTGPWPPYTFAHLTLAEPSHD